MLENPQATKDALIQWIRDYFGKNGPNCSAVVGISGGKDSTIVCVSLGRTRNSGKISERSTRKAPRSSTTQRRTVEICSLVISR